jgi:hypothetical protein
MSRDEGKSRRWLVLVLFDVFATDGRARSDEHEADHFRGGDTDAGGASWAQLANDENDVPSQRAPILAPEGGGAQPQPLRASL